MRYDDFVTDMAIEAAESMGLKELAEQQDLSYGIVQHRLNIKNAELAKRLGRERGIYVTFDCPRAVFDSARACRTLSGYIGKAVSGFIGNVRRSVPVLVIGLGNGGIVADALGKRTVDGINVVTYNGDLNRQCVCAFSAGVLGTTGIPSADIASAITQKINPSAVVLIDSLATSSATRVGCSFQLSTAGIIPGSGVGQDKERIDKSVLKVPTIAIGVPLMLSLRTAVYGFVKDYLSSVNCDVDEYRLRALLVEKKLSNLIVAPKDIDFLVENSALVISDALNEIFAK